MKASETTLPVGPASDQDGLAVGQANSKGSLGSLREKIADACNLHAAESPAVGPLSFDSGAVGRNEVEKSSLPRELRAAVTSTSSRGNSGIDTGTAYPTQPPASVDTGSPQPEPAAVLPPPTSAFAASLPSPMSKEPDVCAAPHIPGLASANAAPLQPNLPVYPPLATAQAATVAYPLSDIYPVSVAPVVYPTYTHPELTRPAPWLFSAYPSFTGPFGNSAAAWNMPMGTPYHEFVPGSPHYYSSTISSASSVFSFSSLFMRHRDEPDCVAAIERIREIDAAMASAAADASVEGYWYRRFVDMDPTRQRTAAHQVLNDCERRRQAVLKRLLMEEEQKIKNLMREIFGQDKDAAVVAWLQDTEQATALNVPADGDDVLEDNALGLYAP